MIFLNNEIVYTFCDIFNSLGIKAYLVGGAIRDLLMGLEPLDFDFVCELSENEHSKVSEEIAKVLNCDFKYNIYYHTSKFLYKGLDIDFVMARKEKYEGIASKPIVMPSNIYDDLKRRDYTINSIAVSLKDKTFEIIDPFKGCDDIKSKKIKVIYNNSFMDDPTRIFRGLKYASRLKFDFEVNTERLIKEALIKGYIMYVPKGRIRNEFELLLKEDSALFTLKIIDRFNIINYILNSNVNINTNYDKIKFNKLSFDEKLSAVFYENSIELIKDIKESLNLNQNFIYNVLALKSLKEKILNNDFEVYKFLFTLKKVKDDLLDVVFGNDERIKNYIQYKNYLTIDKDNIINLSENKRKEYIANKKAENILKLLNGGQGYV